MEFCHFFRHIVLQMYLIYITTSSKICRDTYIIQAPWKLLSGNEGIDFHVWTLQTLTGHWSFLHVVFSKITLN